MTNVIAQDLIFMQEAFRLAKQAEFLNEVPIGAIAVVNNKIVGIGHNCPITTCDPTAHAEIMALKSAAQKLNNYRLLEVTLYVTLEPCIMCVGAMLHARIRRLVFGAYDPKAGAIASIFKILDEGRLNHQIAFHGGVLASECGKLLTEFFQKKR